MNAILERFDFQEKETLGNWRTYKDGILFYVCKTLELHWDNNKRKKSCIPANTYLVKKRWSPRFKWHFHIKDVPNRTWILIHALNHYYQTLGCVGVGSQHIDINGDGILDIIQSRKTLDELLDIMPEEFTLEVRNAS